MNLIDRELLELSAKAARYEIGWIDSITWIQEGERFVECWNPLTDDGDALRLAVKLGLNVDVHRQTALGGTPLVEVRGYVYRRSVAIEQAADNGASLESATRRAIVRAAAEIGKVTKSNHFLEILGNHGRNID